MPSTAKRFPKLAECPSSDKYSPWDALKKKKKKGTDIHGETDATVKEASCNGTLKNWGEEKGAQA